MAYQQLPLGTSDFKSLIEQNKYYIDKTLLISDIIKGSDVTLLPRPRRFGKTLNMSMLNYFFSNKGKNRHLFSGLAIEKNAEAMSHCGQYPVIYLLFKDIKVPNFERCFNKLQYLTKQLYASHDVLLETDVFQENEREEFLSILRGEANQNLVEQSILLLSGLLYRYYQKPVVILIDEYDMPINSAYTNGYYDEMVGFLRNFLSGAFKDNPAVYKGVMTGILRIARESIFSGLNNVDVCTLTSPRYAAHFGFSETETEQLLRDYDLTYEIDAVRSWYNGYNFGDVTIYNPWSIISLALNNGTISPYWLNTSDNALVRDLIAQAPPQVKQELEDLLSDTNAVLRKPLNENVVFRDIERNNDALWNLLLFSGYLRYQRRVFDENTGLSYVDLSIPNQEVRSFYITSILDWFADRPESHLALPDMLSLLLKCDFDSFSRAFRRFCIDTFSYFDVQGKQPERFYHAFVLGMLVQLQSSHHIKSNRESGYGRYDVSVIPHDKAQPGFVFEFKAIDELDNLTLEQACEMALQQIEKKRYVAELHALGIETVYPIAIAFEGKRALVEVVE
jgi:hypothetical protein